jgi:hypothetical protein
MGGCHSGGSGCYGFKRFSTGHGFFHSLREKVKFSGSV